MPELFAGVVVLAIAGIVMTAGFTWLEEQARALDQGLSVKDGRRSLKFQALGKSLRRPRSAARHRACGRARRVHLGRRAIGLRQDHVPAHRRGARAGELRARCCSTAARCAAPAATAASCSRPTACCRGARSSPTRSSGARSPGTVGAGRTARARMELLEARRARRFRALPSAPALRRHAPARQSRPCARHRSGNPADGRAVLLARRADAGDHADRADAHLGGGAQDRAVRHPSDRRGGISVRPRAGVRAPARPVAGERRDRAAAPARARDQAHGANSCATSITSGG